MIDKTTIKIFLTYGLIILLHSRVNAQKLDKIDFSHEELNYQIKYLNLSTGSMQLTMLGIKKIDSTMVYHLRIHTETSSIFSSIFNVNNTYECFFDTLSLLPKLITKQIKQKNLSYFLNLKFDQNLHHILMSDSIEWKIPPACFDFFSMLYFLRKHSFYNNDSLVFFLDSENLTSKCYAWKIGETNISIPAGSFNAIEIALVMNSLNERPKEWKTDLITNRFTKPDSKITLYFSNDVDQLPLAIRFHQKQFHVFMVLKEYKRSDTLK
jgi:hypothetical protein